MTVEVKICGITTDAALDAAISGGAHYIGLVFFAKSPRNIDLAKAAQLVQRARGKAKVVALVVDADDARLIAINDGVAPDIFQLHGNETPERVSEIALLTGRSVIKAVSVSSETDVERALSYTAAASVILFDAKPPSTVSALPGGNGVTFDWSLIAAVGDRLPFMLSGGLTSDNVADAIRQTGATMVDVSSGVESSLGVKDPELIRRFLNTVKTAKQA